MGSNIKGEGPLTILTLCDRLQELLIENGMQDLPVGFLDNFGVFCELIPENVQVDDYTTSRVTNKTVRAVVI